MGNVGGLSGLRNEIMKKVTTRSLIQNVARKWRDQYPDLDAVRAPLFSVREGYEPPIDIRAIADKLDALDKDTASKKDVSDIIGNESWTRITCDECKKEVGAVIVIGDYPNYGSGSFCAWCINDAARLIP